MTLQRIIILLLLLPQFSEAQTQEKEFSLFPQSNYFKSYLSDSRDIIIAPLHLKRQQWINTAIVSGIGIALTTQDQYIYNFINDKQTSFSNNVSKYFLEPLGSGIYTIPFVGMMFLNGTLSHNKRQRQTSLSATKAIIISGIMVQISKQIFHRHRPYQDNIANANNWDGPFSDIKYRSFPSGHSALVFSAATVIASAYHHKKWITITAYSLSTLSALSRIHDNDHWASDVFFGSLTGYLVGKIIYNNDFMNNDKINAGVTNNGIGIILKL